MAACLGKHAFAFLKHDFRYFYVGRGCHALKVGDVIQKSGLCGYRCLSCGVTLRSREDHRVYDESTSDNGSDNHKVENLSSQGSSHRPRNKFETLQARMREKYNLKTSKNPDQDRENLANTSVLENDDLTEDFFGVLSESDSRNANDGNVHRKVQARYFDEVAERHPYLTSKPLRNTLKVYETSFGYMTLDGDVTKGKQKTSKKETVPAEQNFFEEQYFGEVDTYNTTPSEKSEVERSEISTGDDYIENQYFTPIADAALPPWEDMGLDHNKNSDRTGSAETTQECLIPNSSVPVEQFSVTKDLKSDDSELFVHEGPGFTDISHSSDQTDLFTSYVSLDTSSGLSDNVDAFVNDFELQEDSNQEQYFEKYQTLVEGAINDCKSDPVEHPPHQEPLKEVAVPRNTVNAHSDQSRLSDSDTVFIERKTRLEVKVDSYRRPNLSNPTSAFDEAIKIRQELRGKQPAETIDMTNLHPKLQKWKGEKDSKGFRKLKSQVLDIQGLPEEIVVNMLKDSILYENEEMLALYKPYGLPSHGGPGVHHSVGKLLSKLAQKIDKQLKDLYLVHRLDKETTGVMVVAKSQEMAWRLHTMFKKRQVQKKYWVLTKGVPHPIEGVVDIPMGETQVGQYHRMTLRPNYTKDTKLYMTTANKVKKQEAVTNYKVLNSKNSAALVECIPESGVKHQIRCHLAFGLNTPILGDHKYSHVSKVAPQKLYPETLQKLGIRQATVRYLPMHLHAKALVFPELLNGRNVFISARLPKFFIQNMKWLGINIPE